MESQIRPIDYAYEALLNYLQVENLPAHTKLPSERELAQQLGLNRSTLRSAINRLENQGKIYSKKGSGTYVSPLKIVRNIQNSYSTSQALSQYHGKLTTAILHQEKIIANKTIARALKVRLGYDIYCIKRIRYIDDSPMMIETSYLKYEDFQRMETVDFEKESLYQHLKNNGQEVVEGHEVLEILEAGPEEVQFLGVNEKDYVYGQTGVSYDDSGEPIEYFEAKLRGDQIAFESWLT